MRRHAWILVLPLLFAVSCLDRAENPAEPLAEGSAMLSRTSVTGESAVPTGGAWDLMEATGEDVVVLPADREALYDPPGERIKVYTDFDLFDDATGELTEIGFDDLPMYGSSCPYGWEDSIPNPLTIDGVTFSDPDCLISGYCPQPTCPTGGMFLMIHTGATVDFPPETGGIMLVVEGVGDSPFLFRAKDKTEEEIQIISRAIPYGTRYVGFTSSSGIARVEYLGSVTYGTFALVGLYFERLPEEVRPSAERE